MISRRKKSFLYGKIRNLHEGSGGDLATVEKTEPLEAPGDLILIHVLFHVIIQVRMHVVKVFSCEGRGMMNAKKNMHACAQAAHFVWWNMRTTCMIGSSSVLCSM